MHRILRWWEMQAFGFWDSWIYSGGEPIRVVIRRTCRTSWSSTCHDLGDTTSHMWEWKFPVEFLEVQIRRCTWSSVAIDGEAMSQRKEKTQHGMQAVVVKEWMNRGADQSPIMAAFLLVVANKNWNFTTVSAAVPRSFPSFSFLFFILSLHEKFHTVIFTTKDMTHSTHRSAYKKRKKIYNYNYFL